MNLRTQTYQPPAPLGEFVELMWVSEAERFDYANIVLPMLHHEWMISYSDLFDICGADHHAGSWISGVQTKPLHSRTSGKHFTAGVLFRPGGLSAFTRVPASQLTDRSVCASLVFGRDAERIAEEIFVKRDPGSVFQILESFLVGRLQDAASFRTGYILQRLGQSLPEDGLINRIANELNLSCKTLITSFKQYVGLTPAKYHHLVTLRKTLTALQGDEPFTTLAYRLQFSDQSHFNHFFKGYTSMTPSAYRHKIRTGKVSPFNPCSIEK